MKSEVHETYSIEDHISLIRGRVEASRRDPQTRTLAASLVSGAFDQARDTKTGRLVPVVKYHDRLYRGAYDWERARRVCGMRDYMCEVVAIWEFGVMNVRYTADPTGQDYYQDLRTILETGSADCDDTVVLFASLLQEVGYETMAKVISVDGQRWQHIYPLVQVPNRGWVPMDMTEPGKPLGWEFKHPRAVREFEV